MIIRLRSTDTTFELRELLQLCRLEQLGLDCLSDPPCQLDLGRVAFRLFGVVPQTPHLVQKLCGLGIRLSSTDRIIIRLSSTNSSRRAAG